ncbi:MAG: family 16 glycoside hydrolase [Chloroflexota bacterium]|nr:family 16 glycoside hydrolase [Chloroflexota bacterium]
MQLTRLTLLSMVFILLAACARQPTQAVTAGELLRDVRFDDPRDWESYRDPALQVEGQVVDGVYRMTARNGGFMWALSDELYDDVIVEVETEQQSDFADNAYGLMCRAAPDAAGDGYYFFISADGYYTIRRGAGSEVDALVQWTAHDAIQQGRAFNRLRAVCVADYLALYVNNVLVAEVRDRRYQRGAVGMTVALPEDGDNDIVIAFDNLRVFAATIGD